MITTKNTGRIFRQTAIAAALGSAAFLLAPAVQASSHREAPFITTQPKVDATDFYLFNSYEPGRTGFVTLIANYQPLQNPGDGPFFYQFDPDALYEIHVDNNADGVEDLTFQFRFKSTLKDITLPIGGKNVSVPLVHVGALSGQNPANLNVRETYSVDVVRGDRRTGTHGTLTNATDGASTFEKPVDNIGDKTFGSTTAYAAYAAAHTYNVKIPGCADGRVFVGQRKESFYIAVGKIFDLFNLNPLGPVNGNPNSLENKNVSSLILEVPAACLTAAGAPIIGAWTTASLRQARLLSGAPAQGYQTSAKNGGAWTEVSRLSMPLVNEVVIGVKDKDKFNASKPKDDAQFADYVTNPTLPAVVQTLFPSAPAPTNFPRTDLVATFLTGISGLNQPTGVKASEMLRLNTSIAPTAAAAQSNLGVLGGDLAGFPNGRRPGDDVVDATLRVAMGALCVATGPTDTFKVGCKASDAPAGSAALTDGVAKTASDFSAAFPYLNTPIPGNN